MLKRLLVIATLCVMVSGCYMIPMALVGPAASGFTTASIFQAGLTSTANYMVKKSTGKTISQHALESINAGVLKQTYVQVKDQKRLLVAP